MQPISQVEDDFAQWQVNEEERLAKATPKIYLCAFLHGSTIFFAYFMGVRKDHIHYSWRPGEA